MEEYAYEEVIGEYIEGEDTVLLDDPAFFENHMLIVENVIEKKPIPGISSNQRLLLYPEMRRLPVFRKLPTTEVPLILNSNVNTVLHVPDLSFDASLFMEDCPSYDKEIEVASDNVETKNVIPVLLERKTKYASTFAEAIICYDCRFCFRSKTSYISHQNMHSQGIPIKPRVQIQCCFEECDITCDSHPTLIEHLRIQHGQLQLEFITINFENDQKFEEWKDELETRTGSKFLKKWSKNMSSCVSSYFFCHRTGNTPPEDRKNVQRNRSSKKIGSCSAFFHLKQTTDRKITIRGCLEHVGHEIAQIEKTPLSKEIREDIAVYLLEGLDENEIVELMKDNSLPGDRRHYIQPYEVRNVYAKLEKNYTPSDQKMSLLNFQVKEEEIEIPPPYAAIEEVSTTTD